MHNQRQSFASTDPKCRLVHARDLRVGDHLSSPTSTEGREIDEILIATGRVITLYVLDDGTGTHGVNSFEPMTRVCIVGRMTDEEFQEQVRVETEIAVALQNRREGCPVVKGTHNDKPQNRCATSGHLLDADGVCLPCWSEGQETRDIGPSATTRAFMRDAAPMPGGARLR